MTAPTAKLVAAVLALGVCLFFACGGATKQPTMPAPEFEPPILPPWDAGVTAKPESRPSSEPEPQTPETTPADAFPATMPAPSGGANSGPDPILASDAGDVFALPR